MASLAQDDPDARPERDRERRLVAVAVAVAVGVAARAACSGGAPVPVRVGGDRCLWHQLRGALGGGRPEHLADPDALPAAVLGRLAVRLRGDHGGGPAGAVAAIATSTLLGVRNSLYGLQVSRLLGVRGLRRVAAAQVTIDESTAVGVAQPEAAAGRLGFWSTGLGVFVCWNAMTFLGAEVGNAIGDPRHYGLDAAAAAAFCALLWPRLKSADAFAIAALAAVVAVLLAPTLRRASPSSSPLCPRSWRPSGAGATTIRPHRTTGPTSRRLPRGAMSLWTAVLAASALAFVLKFLGYVVPARWLDGERTSRVTSALPIALLAALVGVQTVTTQGRWSSTRAPRPWPSPSWPCSCGRRSSSSWCWPLPWRPDSGCSASPSPSPVSPTSPPVLPRVLPRLIALNPPVSGSRTAETVDSGQ